MTSGASLESRKRELRQAMHALPGPSPSASEAACSRLAGLPQLDGARCVALFASLPDEPSTQPLFELLRIRDLRCLLPRTTDARQLEFSRKVEMDCKRDRERVRMLEEDLLSWSRVQYLMDLNKEDVTKQLTFFYFN